MTSTRSAAVKVATILVAINDARVSASSIAIAKRIALATRAELLLLTILPAPHDYELMGLDARALEDRATQDALDAHLAELGASGVVARTSMVRSDDIATAIVAAAGKHRADMIVLARQGNSDLARAVLGDAAARVIGKAECPVLIVPRDATASISHIVLATDGSPASDAATTIAASCATGIDATVTVLSVEVPTHSENRRAETSEIVERTVARLRRHGVDAHGRTATGLPPEQITRIAGEVGADLVIMGSQGRRGLARVVLGSNCQAVIARASCPVLLATANMTLSHPSAPAPSDDPEIDEPSIVEADVFLTVLDETREMAAALAYAIRRAQETQGRVGLLHLVPADGESPAVARSKLESAVVEVNSQLGRRPVTFERRGAPARELLDLLANAPSIRALVLAASDDPKGPGPLITEIVTRHASEVNIPIVIVPGHKPRIGQ